MTVNLEQESDMVLRLFKACVTACETVNINVNMAKLRKAQAVSRLIEAANTLDELKDMLLSLSNLDEDKFSEYVLLLDDLEGRAGVEFSRDKGDDSDTAITRIRAGLIMFHNRTGNADEVARTLEEGLGELLSLPTLTAAVCITGGVTPNQAGDLGINFRVTLTENKNWW